MAKGMRHGVQGFRLQDLPELLRLWAEVCVYRPTFMATGEKIDAYCSMVDTCTASSRCWWMALGGHARRSTDAMSRSPRDMTFDALRAVPLVLRLCQYQSGQSGRRDRSRSRIRFRDGQTANPRSRNRLQPETTKIDDMCNRPRRCCRTQIMGVAFGYAVPMSR